MKIMFHGDKTNGLDVVIGDMLRFVDVGGSIRQGVLVEIEKCGFPRQGIVYLHVLEGETLKKINTNLIFRCIKVV